MHQTHKGQSDTAVRFPRFNVARLCSHRDTKCCDGHKDGLAGETQSIDKGVTLKALSVEGAKERCARHLRSTKYTRR